MWIGYEPYGRLNGTERDDCMCGSCVKPYESWWSCCLSAEGTVKRHTLRITRSFVWETSSILFRPLFVRPHVCLYMCVSTTAQYSNPAVNSQWKCNIRFKSDYVDDAVELSRSGAPIAGWYWVVCSLRLTRTISTQCVPGYLKVNVCAMQACVSLYIVFYFASCYSFCIRCYILGV